ncbi:hypothetical protein BV898_18661 [Hypsibius exemplaris]|uniref:Uncharacterized protein n=1 Tax=Hypsibius exemplaris TaxID=2072580 RepID=A0A9X6NHZ6_HYPEX|nr:hypothetical protein BV898_18661 [Hypsibius exemplaris]
MPLRHCPSSARSPSFDAEEEELMAAARAAVEAPMPRATARVRDPDDSGSDTRSLPGRLISIRIGQEEALRFLEH